jgi:hypothetical protein
VELEELSREKTTGREKSWRPDQGARMELKASPFAVFDYNHGGRVNLTKGRKYAFALALFFALVLARLLFPFGLLALAIPTLIYLRGERTLKIGPRYLICGDRIVYFANVKNLSFSENEKSICLRTGIKTQLTIEGKRFNVRSRDPEEKAAKFAEAVELVMEGVHRFAPEAICPTEDENACEVLDAEKEGDSLKTDLSGEKHDE